MASGAEDEGISELMDEYDKSRLRLQRSGDLAGLRDLALATLTKSCGDGQEDLRTRVALLVDVHNSETQLGNHETALPYALEADQTARQIKSLDLYSILSIRAEVANSQLRLGQVELSAASVASLTRIAFQETNPGLFASALDTVLSGSEDMEKETVAMLKLALRRLLSDARRDEP